MVPDDELTVEVKAILSFEEEMLLILSILEEEKKRVKRMVFFSAVMTIVLGFLLVKILFFA